MKRIRRHCLSPRAPVCRAHKAEADVQAGNPCATFKCPLGKPPTTATQIKCSQASQISWEHFIENDGQTTFKIIRVHQRIEFTGYRLVKKPAIVHRDPHSSSVVWSNGLPRSR